MTTTEPTRDQLDDEGRIRCATCSGPVRETVDMVCSECGTDYLLAEAFLEHTTSCMRCHTSRADAEHLARIAHRLRFTQAAAS